MTSDPFDVTLTLSDEEYAVLTHALTEYADEREFRSLDEDPATARELRENVDRARRLVDVIERALDES